ncbi:MAG: CPBP family intramembrane metalloprotease [Clostridia bacterium]|nr:CPBP family intramembrane metalloprotease [Clostridia bacterium]
MENQNAPYGRVNTIYDMPDGGLGSSQPMTSGTRRELLLVSGVLGLCILAFYFLSEWSGKVVLQGVNAGVIPYTHSMQQVIQILYTIITILVPFAVGAFFIKRIQKRDELLLLDRPKSRTLFLEAFGIGCAAIIAANLITSALVAFAGGFGVEFDSYKPESPTGVSQMLWMLLSNAIVPAMVEEFALRGVILQSLRRYGDAFAVFASALIFAMMHGNMTQAPFAFLLGAVLAMLVIMTGSLWTSMAVHLFNNTYSVLMTTLYDRGDDQLTAMVTVSVYTLLAIYGVIALVYFFGMHGGLNHLRNRFQPGGPSPEGIRLYRRQAWLYTIISPTMLAALIILVKGLVETVHLKG